MVLAVDETPEARKRNDRRSNRRLILAGALLLLGALVGAALDEDPPNTSRLRPALRQLPNDQNAWLVLQQAAALVKWEPDVEMTPAMELGEKWNGAVASSWLAGHDPVWPLLARAASLPSGQAPVPDSVESLLAMFAGGSTSPPTYRLFGLSTIHAWSLFYDGQPDAAVDALLTSLRAARLLEESRGGPSTYGLGASASRLILKSLVAMAGRKEVTAAAIRRAFAALAQTRPSWEEFVQNLRVTFHFGSLVIETAKQGKERDLLGNGRNLPVVLRHGVNWPLLFKPNQSRRLLAEGYEMTLGLREASWAKADAALTAEYSHLFGDLEHVILQFFRPNNLFGRVYLAATFFPSSGILSSRLSELTTRSAAEAALALRLYFDDHGDLPVTLDKLVPAYLPAVPLDYYDRAPIRYSPGNRAVWSVGRDHFNVTSPAPDPEETEGEIYFPLKFAPVPPVPASAEAAPAP